MAESKRRSRGKRNASGQTPSGPRPFWSGTITFGLVNLPVGLYPANHGKPVRLRMVDERGAPLARRYFCEKEARVLEGRELIRGYPIGEDDFVLVEDRELDALAPEKSQDIDLQRFVALDEIDPIHFERAYFLTPEEGATRAYRLLASSMEAASRAGIATFVMRGKEYLVAIIAEQGILRAETLRFEDELRTPAAIGLPERRQAERDTKRHMLEAMESRAVERLDREALEDVDARRILERVDDKLEHDEDVVEPATEDDDEAEEGGEVIDLMQVLKQSLSEGRSPLENAGGSGSRKSGRSAKRRGQNSKKAGQDGEKKRPRAGSKRASRDGNLDELSKQALYARAQELDIAGRSQMTKAELIAAIEHAA